MRLLTLPLRFLLFPFRLAAVSGRAGWHAGRAVGVSRAAFFGLGFGAGLLVASPKARRVALAGTRRAIVTIAKTREEPPVTDLATVPAVTMTAPHGVGLTDPVPVDTDDPSGPVLPTD